MLDSVYGVKIFFWWFWNVDFYGVHIVVRFDQNVAFLKVFVHIDFDFDAVAGDAADRMFLKFVLLEKHVNDLFIGTVMDGTQNSIANHKPFPCEFRLAYTTSMVSTRSTISVTAAI